MASVVILSLFFHFDPFPYQLLSMLSFVTLPVINVKFCVLQEEMRGRLFQT